MSVANPVVVRTQSHSDAASAVGESFSTAQIATRVLLTAAVILSFSTLYGMLIHITLQ